MTVVSGQADALGESRRSPAEDGRVSLLLAMSVTVYVTNKVHSVVAKCPKLCGIKIQDSRLLFTVILHNIRDVRRK